MRLCDYIKKRAEDSVKQAESLQALQREAQLLREQAEDAETAAKILLWEET